MTSASLIPPGHRLRWGRLLVGVAALGLLTGTACALFLTVLDQVTQWRWDYPALLWLLPMAGAIVGGLYARFGQTVERGNSLLVEQLRLPTQGVPLRMTPLVIVTTWLTHLCGGSAGREGTAVQMGGAIASELARRLGLHPLELRLLILAGIAAGFGGVFGTPIAGTLFAIELATLRVFDRRSVIPCLLAAIISDQVCHAWGVGHTVYAVATLIPAGGSWMACWNTKYVILAAIAGVAFGLVGQLFTSLFAWSQAAFRRASSSPVIRPMLGAAIVIGLTLLLGTRDYLGIGVSTPEAGGTSLTSAFVPGGVAPLSWFWKLLLTAITLGCGFKGGEATPLFFTGATLGHLIAQLAGGPVDLFASLGLVAVFMAATRTPLAGIAMSIELFGGEFVLYHAIVGLTAYGVRWSPGIYEPHSSEAPVGQTILSGPRP